jgi:hypothetical protein
MDMVEIRKTEVFAKWVDGFEEEGHPNGDPPRSGSLGVAPMARLSQPGMT